jgi:Nif-specific regulatory protein
MSLVSSASSATDGPESERYLGSVPAARRAPLESQAGVEASIARVLEETVRRSDARHRAGHAVVYMADPKARTVWVEATYHISTDELRPRFGLGVAGRVCDGGRPIVVPVVSREPMALSELADPAAWRGRTMNLVCVPIPGRRRRPGALSVYFTGEGAPADRLADARAIASAVAEALTSEGSISPEETELPGDRPARTAFEYANMIGASSPMRRVYEEIGQVARTTATALVLGESGTGKELVAQAIHDNSERAGKPFIKLNGAAFPETLFESELFGHERGAFTGAVMRKKGRLDLAQGGTLFLDEVGELPLSTQVKLLRVLQAREYERIGGTETLRADVRLVAATNKNMASAVASGQFREDLYYRLNVFTIVVPPLRERSADIPTLAEFFLEKYAREHRRKARRLSSGAVEALGGYAWPGNVRELENAIERAVVVCPGPVVEEHHLPQTLRAARGGGTTHKLSLSEAVERLERQMIDGALDESRGNLARAARALGTTERIMRYKVQKYGLSLARRSR